MKLGEIELGVGVRGHRAAYPSGTYPHLGFAPNLITHIPNAGFFVSRTFGRDEARADFRCSQDLEAATISRAIEKSQGTDGVCGTACF